MGIANGESNSTERLNCKRLDGGSVLIYITPDKMRVILEITRDEASLSAGNTIDRKTIEKYFSENSITAMIDEKTLSDVVREQREKGIRSYVLNEVKDIFPGKPREVNLLVTNMPCAVSSMAGDGTQQEKKISSLKMVKKGDVICEETPAVPPRYGKNVFGIPLPVPKLRDVAPVPGMNVECRNHKYYAMVDGVFSLNSRREINVLPLKVVEKGLLNEEKVEFGGILVVEGFVKTCGNIKCEILICKEMGMTQAEVGDSVYVLKKISDCTINCGDSVYCGDIVSSTIEAGGNVVVADSIEESDVLSGGKVVCSKKGIFSSKIKAKYSVDVRDIGEVSGKLNEISIGIDGSSDDKMSKLQKDIENCEVNKANIENALRIQQIKLRAKFPHSDVNNHNSLIKLREAVKTINHQILILKKKQEILLKNINERRHLVYLRVRGSAAPGNVISGANSSMILQSAVKSCKFIESIIKDKDNPSSIPQYRMDILFV